MSPVVLLRGRRQAGGGWSAAVGAPWGLQERRAAAAAWACLGCGCCHGGCGGGGACLCQSNWRPLACHQPAPVEAQVVEAGNGEAARAAAPHEKHLLPPHEDAGVRRQRCRGRRSGGAAHRMRRGRQGWTAGCRQQQQRHGPGRAVRSGSAAAAAWPRQSSAQQVRAHAAQQQRAVGCDSQGQRPAWRTTSACSEWKLGNLRQCLKSVSAHASQSAAHGRGVGWRAQGWEAVRHAAPQTPASPASPASPPCICSGPRHPAPPAALRAGPQGASHPPTHP